MSKEQPTLWVSQIPGHNYTTWGIEITSTNKFQPSCVEIRQALEAAGKTVNSEAPTAGTNFQTFKSVIFSFTAASAPYCFQVML